MSLGPNGAFSQKDMEKPAKHYAIASLGFA